VLQNHVLQLLCLVAMEPPTTFAGEFIRDEKLKILHALGPGSRSGVRDWAVAGQYTAGRVDGAKVESYLEEDRIAPDSRMETFVALEAHIDNWRWAGVPFYLRTGKRLPRRLTEIVVQFKRAPFTLFRETTVGGLHSNVLVLRIQPDEGICLSFDAKAPGPLSHLATVNMDFSYSSHFKTEPSTGYETLLFDAMTGDQTLFHRLDIVEAGWQVVDPVLRAWEQDGLSRIPVYEEQSWGPPEADFLLERSARQWRD
jgi:glucose-6-phosphate 1-dehydrogenase